MLRRKTAAALGAVRRNAIACVALFVALGGTGYAAATIGPADIRDDAVRARHIAAGAVWSGQIHDGAIRGRDVDDEALSGAQIRDGGITSRELRNSSVNSADIRDGSLKGADIADDAIGSAQVAPHSIDDFHIQAGAVGANKLAGIFTHSSSFFTESGDTAVHVETCPFGQRLVSGGYFGVQDDVRVLASLPRLDYPDAEDGWEVQVENTSSLPKSIGVVATCLETSH